ncbi:hypothetical protein HYDPIDRAFT_172484 [Hydnomerulius pinastri MD-312]|nr:hypothetical protein HYDPIDRAFT_172484 [Hydnomerulius pinastri MD-312]
MKNSNTLLIARYTFFGLFVICNAIICSVAVWNHSLVHTNQTLQVDVYLIFLGAFNLVSVFTFIFAELLCGNPLTTRVWFECGWIGLFWLMHLAGAAAVTAIEPDLHCNSRVITFVHSLCTSERVLLAFTWMCTVILLLYFLLLIFIAVTHQRDDPGVWSSSVHNLRWVTARQCLSSAPNSPSDPRFKKRAPVDIYNPRPVRPVPVPAYVHRGGLSPEYEIEHYRPAFSATDHMDLESSLSLPDVIPAPRTIPVPAMPAPVMLHSEAPRYPAPGQHQLPSSIIYAGQPSAPTQAVPSSLPSPPPLGEWPRRDIMEQPIKNKRKPPPPSSFEFPKRSTIPVTDRPPIASPPDPPSQPRVRRPSGPRMRTPSGDNTQRPVPLDLSGISNHDIGNAYTQRDEF